MVYASPRPAKESLHLLYGDVSDEVYASVESGRRDMAKRLLQSFPQKGSLLDLGAGTGVFLDEARHQGFSVYGIEPSLFYAKQAKEHFNLALKTEPFPNNLFDSMQFDYITLWDIIEHVDDPSAVVKKAYALLKPGGMIFISTMNVDSLFAKVSGRRWPWYMAMHIYYFSKRSLRQLVMNQGFTDVSTRLYVHHCKLSYIALKFSESCFKLPQFIFKIIERMGDPVIPFTLGDMILLSAKK
jgi:SAM-dependent methyltransferase